MNAIRFRGDGNDCESQEVKNAKVHGSVPIDSTRGEAHFVRSDESIRVLSHGELQQVEFEGI